MTGAAIQTERLTLRALLPADRAPIQAAAGRREIADTMISIPHPFSSGDAERYCRARIAQSRRGRALAFGLWSRADQTFCGLLELRAIDREHALAELSFWLAVDCWGQGYMGEAITAVLRLAFQDLGLNRVYAYHMTRNPASGRLLARLGFHAEGLLRQRVRKWGVFEDVILQALLRQDWLGTTGNGEHEK
jgi:[ribosomal protein S5]-alanine N-acetyltransferase